MADDLLIEAPPAPPARVWFGIIAPPAVWGLQGAVLWFVDWLACPTASAACMTSAGKHLWGVQLGVSLGALAVSLVAFALNVKPYQRVSGEPLARVEAHSRPDFLRAAALLISLVFGLGIVFAGLSPFFLGTCARVR